MKKWIIIILVAATNAAVLSSCNRDRCPATGGTIQVVPDTQDANG